MALASQFSPAVILFCCGRWGVSVAAPRAWVSELRGGSGWFAGSIRGVILRYFSGEFWVGRRGLGFRACVG